MPLFNRRNSKEERVGKEESAAPESAPPPPSPAAGRVSSQEAEAINDLLKATGNGERVGPIRERRLSNGNIDPFKCARLDTTCAHAASLSPSSILK